MLLIVLDSANLANEMGQRKIIKLIIIEHFGFLSFMCVGIGQELWSRFDY